MFLFILINILYYFREERHTYIDSLQYSTLLKCLN
jgi:hypothetical protein